MYDVAADPPIWDLSDLYKGADDPSLGRDRDNLRESAAAFSGRYRERIADLDEHALGVAVSEFERIRALAARIESYAYLSFQADRQDDELSRLLHTIEGETREARDEILFFDLEWSAVDDDRAEAMLRSDELARYRHPLRVRRLERPYFLSESEERIASAKEATACTAWQRLDGNLLAEARPELQGVELGLDEAWERFQLLPDRDDRRALAASIASALETNLSVRAHALNAIIEYRYTEDRLRGYPTWVSRRNLENEISDEAVESFVDVVGSRYDLAQRLHRLRARALGLSRLADHDLTAPVGAGQAAIGWDEARGIALAAFETFSPVAAGIARQFFDGRWIDAEPRPRKATGAFCLDVAGCHPYILMSYTGAPESVAALAHELGHGVHGMLADAVGYLAAERRLTLCETASVLAETLAFDLLVERAEDDRSRLALLVQQLDGIHLNLFETVARYRFEARAHALWRAEGELSVDAIETLWLDELGALFGETVELTRLSRRSWCRFQHPVAAPGYMYAYPFGLLLALAVVQLFRREGRAGADAIVAFLAKGATASPAELLGELGLDLSDPGFWQQGFDEVESTIARAEALAATP